MKFIYGNDIDDMFYKYKKYNANPKPEPISKLIYKNDIQRFLNRLDELEKEFGFEIVADYSEDDDGFIEAEMLLYDNVYGCIGEIIEENEEEIHANGGLE